MSKQQQEVVPISFKKGDAVTHHDTHGDESFTVEAESVKRPGWVYCRDMDNNLWLVHFTSLSRPA